MITSLDTWSGLAIFVEVFWKSGVALGAALGANALLRKRSADLRRLTLSTSVAAMCMAAVFPALPRWTAAVPDWLRVERPSPPTAVERSRGPAVLDARLRTLSLPGAPQSVDLAPHRVPVIPVIWFAGSATLLLRFLVGLRKLRRLRIASHALNDEELLGHLDQAGRHRRVLLVRSETIGAPVTWGIVQPVILVPSDFEQLPAECRSQVLCHELAHVHNHDFLPRVLVEIARAVIWFQPLMWIARRQLREEQELACDNRVLAAGGRSSAYAKLLLEWNDRLFEKDPLVAIGMAQRSCLKRRLYALLDLHARRDTVSRASIAATGLLGLAMALPLAAFRFAPTPAAIRHMEMESHPRVVEARPMPPPVAAVPQVALAHAASANAAPVQATTAPPQTPDSQVVFEAASIKHGPPGDYSAGGSGGPGTGDPTSWSIENYPVSSLLGVAYGTNTYQLSGPGWLDDERFTIRARLAKDTTKQQLALMLRNLLIERFKLAAHFEKKDIAGYQLVVVKDGPKLTVSPGDPSQVDDPANPPAPFKWTVDKDGYPELPPGRRYAMAMGMNRARWRFADETMEHFAETLGGQIRRPILDATSLKGKYDFVISWYATMDPETPSDSGPSIFVAVQEQLGLKLESKKIPVDILVIDHIEKTPTEN
jgi:uncharacterized protein (TIGR03435 family)